VNPKMLVMLKGLLDQSGHANSLLTYLPKAQVQALQNLPSQESFDFRDLLSQEQWSKPIHFSWFAQMFKLYPLPVQAIFLGILDPAQTKGVQGILSPALPPKTITPFLRPFLMNILHKSMQETETDLIDAHHLPPSPLNSLLHITRKQLIHTADFLGLYDLAADLRQVVDKNLLATVYHALNQEQRVFLNDCSKQSLKWVSPKLGLSAWDRSKKQLNHLLHYRGLLRLAKAIYQENPSFKWHLLHRFDTGRAKMIQKELYQKQDLALIPYFRNQVLHIVKRYSP
jgi:hypothetical protein